VSTRSLPAVGVLVLLVGLAGCASTGDGERASRQHRNILTEDEIQAGQHLTAFDVVRTLRPAWLRERPMSVTNPEGAEVVVYVDGMRMSGGAETLRQVRAETVVRMEFMTASDATTRFGTGHMGGAILVTTRRG
jgi:hypothetical protein